MSELGGDRTGDPYGARRPTSHEREAGQPWEASYHGGPAPWDIGHPQPAIARLAAEDAFVGEVLDAGCGTGDNALCIAARGLHVLGVDVAQTAVSIANEKATAAGVRAEFVVGDALHLERLGRTFDTVLDSALFHALDRDERLEYVAGLASVTRPGGTVYVLCFSDADPENAGPHPVSEHELRAPFEAGDGWAVASISADVAQSRFAPEGVPAWLAKIERIDPRA